MSKFIWAGNLIYNARKFIYFYENQRFNLNLSHGLMGQYLFIVEGLVLLWILKV